LKDFGGLTWRRGLSRSKPAVDLQLSRASPRGFQTPPAAQPQRGSRPQERPPSVDSGSAAGGAQLRCPNVIIKGNISAKGAKIYHKPGDRFYTAVQINTAAGERYFCSEQDALDAGWRAAR